MSRIDVETKSFNIDRAIFEAFGVHPLCYPIMWDYFLDGAHEDDDLREAKFGPTERFNQSITERVGPPRRAPAQFWKYHMRYTAPSVKQVSNWRKDYVEQVVFVNQSYQEQEIPLFTSHERIRDEMVKEFPKSRDNF